MQGGIVGRETGRLIFRTLLLSDISDFQNIVRNTLVIDINMFLIFYSLDDAYSKWQSNDFIECFGNDLNYHHLNEDGMGYTTIKS